MITQIEILSKKTNHVLHLLLSLITAGFWVPVWIMVACANCSARNDIRRTAGLKQESNDAGVVIVLLFCLFVVVMVAGG
jgi:hypothetical protein